jgi:hypothetical protein
MQEAREASGQPEASQETAQPFSVRAAIHSFASHDSHERLQVVETERGAVAPGTGLILEWSGEGRCEERALLATCRAHRTPGGGAGYVRWRGPPEILLLLRHTSTVC